MTGLLDSRTRAVASDAGRRDHAARHREFARRCAASAAPSARPAVPHDEVEAWFAARQARNAFTVARIPLAAMAGWNTDAGTGTLAHDSGRFFAVEGLRVSAASGPAGTWEQPILVQREIGILGIVVADLGGVLHCLMQAKAEPGNTGGVRLSPTVNATRSNYTGVHHGRAIPYLDAFVGPDPARVHVDRLQSERGSWFLRKRNRHLVVEALEPLEPREDFCWLTLYQLRRMLVRDNVMSMEACSVLSCLPIEPSRDPETRAVAAASPEDWPAALLASGDPGAGLARARHGLDEVIGRLCEIKAGTEVGQRRVPLNAIAPWRRGESGIARPDGRYFAIIGAEVTAESREVSHWSQPLLAPVPGGIAALITRRFGGVLHLLLHARIEAGAVDVAEFGPTVLCTPANHFDARPEARPRYLDAVLAAASASAGGSAPSAGTSAGMTVRYDTVISEEGARFYHAESRYLILDAGPDFPADTPEDFVWVTAAQAACLLGYGYYLNMQARTLLTALHALW